MDLRHSRRASAVEISSDHGPGLCIKRLNQQYDWHSNVLAEVADTTHICCLPNQSH